MIKTITYTCTFLCAALIASVFVTLLLGIGGMIISWGGLAINILAAVIMGFFAFAFGYLASFDAIPDEHGN